MRGLNLASLWFSLVHALSDYYREQMFSDRTDICIETCHHGFSEVEELEEMFYDITGICIETCHHGFSEVEELEDMFYFITGNCMASLQYRFSCVHSESIIPSA